MSVLSSDDKLMVILSYLGLFLLAIPTAIIFFMKRQESPMIAFHGLQAIGIFVGNLILHFALGLIMPIPVLGLVAILGSGVLSLAAFGLVIYLVIQTAQGKDTRLPILAPWLEKQFLSA